MEPRKMWKRYLVTNTEFAGLAAREVLRLRTGLGRDRG
jgi:UDP-N-acetyl-D-mannosaminuronic acid transferase (WecB/TagA/CpsF family)